MTNRPYVLHALHFLSILAFPHANAIAKFSKIDRVVRAGPQFDLLYKKSVNS